MDDAKLRAWWWHRQGLDGTLAKAAPADVLAKTGWARSVGGAGPYLTLFARNGASRKAIDDAVAKQEIHELPSARGCTYVVPASDFGLALHASQGFSSDTEVRVAKKLGVTDKELEKLNTAVLAAVAKKPVPPEEIRASVGSAARSLGEEGKKKGLTTTLPVALGMLQATGEIRRVPVDGRLDNQRYAYVAWKPNPLAKWKKAIEETHTELARRFFQWIGPATQAEFQWFSGLGVKASKAALEPLKLVPVEPGSERMLLPEDKGPFASVTAKKGAQYALVSCLDGLFHLRRDISLHLDAADRKQKAYVEKSVETLNGLLDLPSHAIVDRGRLVGLWEYDPDSEKIVWASFGLKDKALNEAVERTESYIRSDLGDARSFSLDSPKSRAPRIAQLRKAAKG